MPTVQKPVSCLIPAYNEAATITNVLRPVAAHPQVGQIVVVDDGSKDGTAEKAAQIEGVTVLVNQKNLGKGGAVQRGLAQLTGDVVLMLDADLVDLTPEHVDCLLAPVLENEGVTTLGVFTEHGKLGTEMAMRVLPFLSGQRAIRKVDLEGLPDLGKAGYGIEMVLTKHIKDKGLTVLHVYLKGMRHLVKEEKMGFLGGTAQQLKMYYEVLKKMIELDAQPKEPLSISMRREAEAAAGDLERLMAKGMKVERPAEEIRQWQHDVKEALTRFTGLIKGRG